MGTGLVLSILVVVTGALFVWRRQERRDERLFALEQILGIRCQVCGCSDEEACPGGCAWVAPGLCSSCASPGGAVVRLFDQEADDEAGLLEWLLDRDRRGVISAEDAARLERELRPSRRFT